MLQTRIKNRLVRRGIVALALLATLPGCTTNGGTTDERRSSTPVVAEQTFDEAVAAYERGDYDTAMQGFRVHAEQGNAEAQLNLGVMYANSLGVPEDDAEAARWFRKAAEQGDFAALRALAARGDYDTAMQGFRVHAEQGNAEAQFNLGQMYDRRSRRITTGLGMDVSKDKAEAVKWYRKAAEQGHAQGQYELGQMYDLGMLGVPKDKAEALRWYRKAGEQGHVRALRTLAALYAGQYEGFPVDKAEAVRWYRKAAEQGNSGDQDRLGQVYDFGQGVPEDDAEAARWYRKAADQGYSSAQYSLGIMCAYGEGVPENDAEAVKWLRKAGERGAVKLFLMYSYGDGLPKDHTEAMKWLRRAAEESYVFYAPFDRDLMRAYGEVVPEDLEDYSEWLRKAADVQFNVVAAVRWFRTVAEHEQSILGSAAFNLGVIYDIGVGVPEDDAEAARWFRKAAEQGDSTALLITGQGYWQDKAREVKWLRRGAELGFSQAQVRLGFKYASGEGVLKDSVLAHMWLNIAGANGSEVAREWRDNFERDMTRAEISRATELARECMASDYQDCEP